MKRLAMKKSSTNFLLCTALIIGCMSFVCCGNTEAKTNPAAVSDTRPVAASTALVDLTYAAETSVNAVVYIKVTTNSKTQTVDVQDPFADLFGEFFGFGGGTQRRQIQTPKREAAGSGVIISADGYIVTNNHVVKDADVLLVKLNDNREFAGRIVGTDEQTDLALIKIDGEEFPTLPIGNSDELKVGEWVLAVGNPFNLNSTVTAGIVSAKARSMGANSIESFIQTDAAINQGNSGGALVNARGELVGINAMIYSQTGSYTGYGFAIPTTIMNKVVADLKEYGIVQRAQLGVMGSDVANYVDSEKAKGNDIDLGTMNGVYIAEVQVGSAAAEGGLQQGDVVVSFNGKEVNKMAQLQEAVNAKRPGDKVEVGYIRNKKHHSVQVTLRNAQGNTKVVEKTDVDDLGVALKALDGEELQRLRLPYGLEVTAVRSGKMADAGVTKGVIILQVNDRAMRTPDDFEEVVKSAGRTSDNALWIRALMPSGRKQSFVVELGK